MNEINVDVLIIGAGFSGIAAAKKLFQSGKTFAVIEARNRIGGRTLTETLPCARLSISARNGSDQLSIIYGIG
jgi:monoamine oxidase